MKQNTLAHAVQSIDPQVEVQPAEHDRTELRILDELELALAGGRFFFLASGSLRRSGMRARLT